MSSESVALPTGCYPTMITPFTDGPSGSVIDYRALQALVEWYIAGGVDGLFAVCQSSEMFFLSQEERQKLATEVVKFADDRVPVIACGTFGDDIEAMAEEVKSMSSIVKAVVVVVGQMCKPEDSDEVWRANVQRLLDLTGDVPLGLYECPKPYHRLLSAETLAWAAGTGRFLFHKDTCCARAPISAKIKATSELGTPFRFYNANVATLEFSLKDGGHGFSGISANFYPWLLKWLCANYDKEPEKAAKLQRFLAVAENVVADTYPKSAKLYLDQYSAFTISPFCRCMPDSTDLNEEQRLKLEALKGMVQDISDELGISPPEPRLA